MRIVIETIPHKDQRYATAGDWWIDPDGTWQIRVSEMRDWKAEYLVAFHELAEMALCVDRHIPEERVTQFDQHWDALGRQGEPGDSQFSPYYDEHQFASGIERMMCEALSCAWGWYTDEVDALDTPEG
jgi:hypothetical protein